MFILLSTSSYVEINNTKECPSFCVPPPPLDKNHCDWRGESHLFADHNVKETSGAQGRKIKKEEEERRGKDRGLQSAMDEEREEGGPTSKTALSGEHGRRSKAK
ncbi:unnamed protein product, partial [Arctogadus glacialis]